MAVIATPRVLLRCLAVAAWALALTACATMADPSPAPPDYDRLVGQAQVQAGAGRIDQAVATLERAATADPARSEPWRQIARLRFGAGEYALALAAADEALRRDPADPQARDVFIASGLQIAIETLRRLRAAGDGQVDAQRVQADKLAELMVQVFGAEMLVSEELKASLAQQAIDQWKQTHAGELDAQPPERRPSPLDVLGGD